MRSLVVKLAMLMAVGYCAQDSTSSKSKSTTKANPNSNNSKNSADSKDNTQNEEGEVDETRGTTNSAYTIPGLLFGTVLLIAGLTM